MPDFSQLAEVSIHIVQFGSKSLKPFSSGIESAPKNGSANGLSINQDSNRHAFGAVIRNFGSQRNSVCYSSLNLLHSQTLSILVVQ